MQFEVTNKHEQREGLIMKKTVYLGRANIHLNDEEFEALQSMAKSKEWAEYPLGDIQVTPKIRQTVTMSMCLAWAKKTKSFEKGIRTHLPEDRELQIAEVREVATNLKQVLEARVSALNASDEDILEEI
jgi:hypothetical protein